MKWHSNLSANSIHSPAVVVANQLGMVLNVLERGLCPVFARASTNSAVHGSLVGTAVAPETGVSNVISGVVVRLIDPDGKAGGGLTRCISWDSNSHLLLPCGIAILMVTAQEISATVEVQK